MSNDHRGPLGPSGYPNVGGDGEHSRVAIASSSHRGLIYFGGTLSAHGIASGIPSTLSQQFPRETIPKCASSDGETILPEEA
jgi:hypothetical protein